MSYFHYTHSEKTLCFHFLPLLGVSSFTFLGCFHFSPSSVFHFSPFLGVFIFHLSQVFSFFTFLRCFHFSPFSGASFFTFFECFCVAVQQVLQIWETFFYSQAFVTLHSFPTFSTICFYQCFLGSQCNGELRLPRFKTSPVLIHRWIRTPPV